MCFLSELTDINSFNKKKLLTAYSAYITLDWFYTMCRMSQYLEDTKDDVLKKGKKLENDGWEAYLNS